MAKIPFDVKFRPQIESGEYKVGTRDGRVVHNIWRVKEPFYTNNRRAEVCALIDGEEDALVFFEGGRYLPTTKDTDSPFDLFIVTPEPEMTTFEKKVYAYCDGKTVGEELIKRIAKELLDYARKELEPEVLERLEVAYKNQDEVVYENGKRDGKAEALKDLPRWDFIRNYGYSQKSFEKTFYDDTIGQLFHKGRKLYIGDLEKLPGFKED